MVSTCSGISAVKHRCFRLNHLKSLEHVTFLVTLGTTYQLIFWNDYEITPTFKQSHEEKQHDDHDADDDDNDNDDDIEDYSKDSSFMIKHEWCMMHDNSMAPSYSETGEGDRGVGGQEKWNLSWNGGCFCCVAFFLFVLGKGASLHRSLWAFDCIRVVVDSCLIMILDDFGITLEFSDKQFHSPLQSLSHQMRSTKNDHTLISTDLPESG